MKTARYFLSVVFLVSTCYWTTRSQVFYDTVSVRSVGPGMTHYLIIAPAVPWNINVLKVDLKNPYLSVETVKANDRLAGREIISSMAARKSSLGHEAIGAINGDFYSGDGSPTNIQISRGEILLRPVSRPALGFSADNTPMIDVVSMSISVLVEDTVVTVQGVNTTRQTDQLILFNSYRGTTTGTNEFGTEAMIRPVFSWISNDSVVCVVESVQVRVGNMTIPKGWAVLSGHGVSESNIMSRVQPGDTVRLYQNIAPGLKKLKEMIGGSERIIHNGTNVGAWPERHPRTAVAFSQDSTTLFLVTVDGRQAFSAGMTLTEMGEFLLDLGIYQAINLDGGGSTTMVIRDSVMNSPSDGGQRAVSNGLLVISSAPTGQLDKVSISPKNTRIFRGSTKRFVAFGNDQYGNPVSLDHSASRFSCDEHIGTIDSLSGVFMAGTTSAVGYVRIRYSSFSDSARVVVKILGRHVLTPVDVVTDTTRTVSFNVESYDTDVLRQSIPLNDYQWTLTNPSVGSISNVGVFKGLKQGTTHVVASLDGLSDTSLVRIEIGQVSSVLDSLEDLSKWTMAGALVDSFSVSVVDSVSTLGTSSLRIDYAFTGSANISYVYLDANIPVFGVPDSILLDGRTDNHSHRLYYIVEDDNGEVFRLYSSRLMNRIGLIDTIRAPIFPNQPVTTNAVFNFPMTLKRIEIQLVYNRVSGTFYSGSLFLDNLRVSYPQKIMTSVVYRDRVMPEGFRLDQNYPNPFNSSTRIRFSIPARQWVELKLYDILGRLRKVVVSRVFEAGEHIEKLQTDDLTTGVYFLRASASRMKTSKMVLIK